MLFDGRPVGQLVVNETASEVVMVNMALLPAFRSGGISALLIRRLQRFAAQTGRVVLLNIEQNNPARALYQRLGFEIHGTDGMYFERYGEEYPGDGRNHLESLDRLFALRILVGGP